MTYAARWGILFVLTLFASRVSSGVIIENHWYSFFWALFVAGLNASIRSILLINHIKRTWVTIALLVCLLNLLLYWLLYIGVAKWLGIYAISFGSALLPAVIVAFCSTICNHFIGFKGPQK